MPKRYYDGLFSTSTSKFNVSNWALLEDTFGCPVACEKERRGTKVTLDEVVVNWDDKEQATSFDVTYSIKNADNVRQN